MSGSIRYTTTPQLFRWYERLFSSPTFTKVVGTFTGLFTHGGPYRVGVSSYLPPIMNTLIKNIPDSHYMICPLFDRTMGYYTEDPRGGEFQLGVTGTGHNGEDTMGTLHREAAEELGLLISPTHNIIKELTFHGTTVNITDSTISTALPEKPPTGTDDITAKVACIIHGEEQDIIEKYLDAPLIKQWPSRDGIIGSMVIPVKIVKMYIITPRPQHPICIPPYHPRYSLPFVV